MAVEKMKERRDSEVMWTDVAQAVSGVLTVIVTVLGFWFLYVQIDQAKQSLNGQTHAVIYEQQQAINQIFIDHPELRKYFYENCELTDKDPNENLVLPTADTMADFFEHVTQQRTNLPHKIWPAWVRYMRDVYKNSPVLRHHFEKNAHWYDEDYVAFIKGQSDLKP